LAEKFLQYFIWLKILHVLAWSVLFCINFKIFKLFFFQFFSSITLLITQMLMKNFNGYLISLCQKHALIFYTHMKEKNQLVWE